MFPPCLNRMEGHCLTLMIVAVFCSIQTGFSTRGEKRFINNVNGFALDMYKSLGEKPGNIFFSPISISFAIAMTSLGAKGNTLEEMLTTIKMNSFNEKYVHRWFQQLGISLKNKEAQKDYTLSMANRLFGEKSYAFVNKFIQDTTRYYNAKPKAVDFQNNPEKARNGINDWISSFTNGMIKNMLGPGTVPRYTKLILVNAIYFKGEWLSQFNPKETKKSNFYVSKTDIVKVDLMSRTFNFRYGYSTTLKSQLLELPYKGKHLSMVIILPDLERTSLNEVEKSLTPEVLASFYMYNRECIVSLPKFKLQSSFKLNKYLKKLGMKDLFKPGVADLSGIDASKGLHVSSVLHKAIIEVNEEGTEAAAATGVRAITVSALREFKADHPFIFFIKDNSKNSILFLGRFIRP